MALEHLLNTRERDRCVQLVTSLVLSTYQAGQMSTVQRGSPASAPGGEGFPPLAVLAGWIAAFSGRRKHNGGRQSSTMPSSTSSPSMDRHRSSLPRDAPCEHVPAGPEQRARRADLAPRAEPAWSPWRDTAASLLRPSCSWTTSPAPPTSSPSHELAETLGNPDTFILSQAELAIMAMNQRRWTAAPRTSARRQTIESTECTSTRQSLAFRRPPGSPPIPAIGLRRAPAGPGDAGPSYLQHTPPASPSEHDCSSPTVYRELTDLATHDTCCARSTTSWHRRSWARWSTTLGNFDGSLGRAPPAVADAAPLTQAELRFLPYLQTHLKSANRRTAVCQRNTVATQIGSIYRKLGVSSRSEAVARATAIGLLGD